MEQVFLFIGMETGGLKNDFDRPCVTGNILDESDLPYTHEQIVSLSSKHSEYEYFETKTVWRRER